MELQYHGANCVTISTKISSIITDPASEFAKLSPNLKKVTKVLYTGPVRAKTNEDQFVIETPGEYEFEDCSIRGVAVQRALEASGDSSGVMYKVSTTEGSILVYGLTGGALSEDTLEVVGTVDVLVLPVGGSGVAPDAISAAAAVRAIEPKVIVPVYYLEDKVSYEVPPAQLEVFVKEIGAPLADVVEKLKLKNLPEQMTIQPLSVI